MAGAISLHGTGPCRPGVCPPQSLLTINNQQPISPDARCIWGAVVGTVSLVLPLFPVRSTRIWPLQRVPWILWYGCRHSVPSQPCQHVHVQSGHKKIARPLVPKCKSNAIKVGAKSDCIGIDVRGRLASHRKPVPVGIQVPDTLPAPRRCGRSVPCTRPVNPPLQVCIQSRLDLDVAHCFIKMPPPPTLWIISLSSCLGWLY